MTSPSPYLHHKAGVTPLDTTFLVNSSRQTTSLRWWCILAFPVWEHTCWICDMWLSSHCWLAKIWNQMHMLETTWILSQYMHSICITVVFCDNSHSNATFNFCPDQLGCVCCPEVRVCLLGPIRWPDQLGCVRLPRPARVCCNGVWLEIGLGLGDSLVYAGNWRCLRLWGVRAFELGITIRLMSYMVFVLYLYGVVVPYIMMWLWKNFMHCDDSRINT